jgi:hypothetical protein
MFSMSTWINVFLKKSVKWLFDGYLLGDTKKLLYVSDTSWHGLYIYVEIFRIIDDVLDEIYNKTFCTQKWYSIFFSFLINS